MLFLTMKKGFTSITILVLIVLAIVGYLGYKNWAKVQTADPNADWKTYTNKGLLYTLKYPSNFSAGLTNSGILRLRSIEMVQKSETIEGEQIEEGDNKFDSTVQVKTNKNRLELKKFIEQEERIINGKITDTAEFVGTPIIRNFSLEKKTVDNKPAYLFRADPCSICRFKTYKTYIEYSPGEIIV